RESRSTPLSLVETSRRMIESPRSGGAVVHFDEDWAYEQAVRCEHRPSGFGGVPILVKDGALKVAGQPYFFGSRMLASKKHFSRQTSQLVADFMSVGFIIAGLSATPELASAFHTESLSFGTTFNPVVPHRT